MKYESSYSFLILFHTFLSGAQKCGTTSLNQFFEDSGKICKGDHKEKHFFDDEFDKGMNYYRADFQECHSSSLTIDATPNYLTFSSEITSRRIFQSYTPEELKHKKFIIILRDPAYREFSWYSHLIRECSKRMNKYIHAQGKTPPRNGWNTAEMCGDGWQCSHVRCRQKARYAIYHEEPKYLSTFAEYFADGEAGNGSMYINQINNFARYIPRHQMFIVNLQTMFADEPTETLRRVARFLDLPVNTFGNSVQLPHRNEAGVPTYYDCPTAQKLQEFFVPYNEQLYEYFRTTRANASGFEPPFPHFEPHKCGQ